MNSSVQKTISPFAWYKLATLFIIIQCLEGFSFIDRLVYGEWSGKPGDKLTRSINVLTILFACLLLLRGSHQLRQIRAGALVGIALAGFLFCSSFWSVAPEVTQTEALLYLVIIIASMGIATNLNADEFMELLAFACVSAAIGSVLLLIVYPSDAYGPDGDFRGIFSQKNILGEAMTMGALATLHGLRTRDGHWVRHATSLAVITAVALFAASATSLITITAFVVFDVFLRMFKKGGIQRLLALGTLYWAIPLLVGVISFKDTILEVFNRDPTLTGRTTIWSLIMPAIHQRPWFGWGYAAFWSDQNPVATEISDLLHWDVPESHNGLLEIWLFVGAVGCVIFILLWARTAWLALQCTRISWSLGTTGLLLCLGILLVGISERVLVEPFEASTHVFFVIGMLCETQFRAARFRRNIPKTVSYSLIENRY